MTILKKLSLLIVLTLAATFCFAQQSPVKDFMKEMKKRDRSEVTKIGIGRIPIVVAKWFIEDDLKPIAKHVRKFRLLNISSAEVAEKADWKRLNKEMDKAGFEDMIMVKSDGSDISIRMKGDDEKIRFLTAFIKEGAERTLIEVKTKMTHEQFDQLLAQYSE